MTVQLRGQGDGKEPISRKKKARSRVDLHTEHKMAAGVVVVVVGKGPGSERKRSVHCPAAANADLSPIRSSMLY